MRKGFTVFGVLVSIALLTLLTIACGGGGGDSTSATPPATAATAQTLDKKTVDDLVQSVEGLLPMCAMNTVAPAATSAIRSVIGLSNEIVDQVQVVHVGNPSIAAVTDESPPPIAGTCPTNPGELTIQLLVDDVANTLSGSIDFNAFCAEIDDTDQINIDGGGSFDGTVVLDSTDELQSATLNFSTAPGGIEIVTAEGSANIAITGFSVSIDTNTDGELSSLTVSITSMTVTETDSEGTETFTLTGFTTTVTATDTSVTITASGTIDESGVGTVSFSTTGLTVDSDGNVSGSDIILTGANGTSVTATPVGGNDFLINADTDGDGVSDYDLGTMNCDENPLTGVSLF